MSIPKQVSVRLEASSFLEVSSPSGVGQYSRRLSEALEESNITTLALTCGPFFTSNTQTERPTGTQTLLNKIYRKMSSALPILPFDTSLPSVDITIFPNFFTLPTSKSGVTACVVHDLTYLYHPELLERKNLRYLQRVVPASIKRADIIITVSETTKHELVKEFGVDPQRCVVTPALPDEKFYTSNPRDIRGTYGIKTDNYLLFVGNLEPRKQVDTLLEAYQALPSELQQSHSLVIAGGSGWKSDALQAKIIDAVQSAPNIVQTGYVNDDDIPALYQDASVFVMPSIYEGFGMPILEAMAAKTPVISSDIPVLKEAGGDAALYFKTGDHVDLRNTLEKLLCSPGLRDELLQKASTHTTALSWENNVKKIIEKVHELT